MVITHAPDTLCASIAYKQKGARIDRRQRPQFEPRYRRL